LKDGMVLMKIEDEK